MLSSHSKHTEKYQQKYQQNSNCSAVGGLQHSDQDSSELLDQSARGIV